MPEGVTLFIVFKFKHLESSHREYRDPWCQRLICFVAKCAYQPQNESLRQYEEGYINWSLKLLNIDKAATPKVI